MKYIYSSFLLFFFLTIFFSLLMLSSSSTLSLPLPISSLELSLCVQFFVTSYFSFLPSNRFDCKVLFLYCHYYCYCRCHNHHCHIMSLNSYLFLNLFLFLLLFFFDYFFDFFVREIVRIHTGIVHLFESYGERIFNGSTRFIGCGDTANSIIPV